MKTFSIFFIKTTTGLLCFLKLFCMFNIPLYISSIKPLISLDGPQAAPVEKVVTINPKTETDNVSEKDIVAVSIKVSMVFNEVD